MKPPKFSPAVCALIAFLAVPFALVAILFLAVGLVTLAVIYWPVIPFVVYALRRERKDYGKTEISPGQTPEPV